MSHFEQLKVWQRAVDLSIKVYEKTSIGPFIKDFGLRDQMRRASVSIPCNIAEGDELESDRSSVRHLRIAKGSAGELFTQVLIAFKIDYLSKIDYEDLQSECKEIIAMLTSLIKYRKKL